MTKEKLYRAIARCIIHAENNMSQLEYIQDIKQEIREEERENDKSTITKPCKHEQQDHQRSA